MPAAIHSSGPGFADWDLSLLKSTALTERMRVQFRAEFFNMLNHTNLQLPNEVVYSAGPTQGTTANQNTAATLRFAGSHFGDGQYQSPDSIGIEDPVLEKTR